MKRRSLGADEGRTIVYFHGAPGAPSEAKVFEACIKERGIKLVCQDRFALDAGLSEDQYFQALAADITHLSQGKQVDIIGFSIGAFVAMKVARVNQDQVRSLHLISPAAPFQGGDFMDGMAGKAVFRLAQKSPAAFKLLSHGQGLLAGLSTKALMAMLFGSAVAGDKLLVNDADFQKFIGGVLTECLSGHLQGYIRDVLAYVAPWQATLSEITVQTHLWHGVQDNWSPIAMSEYLSEKIPGFAKMTRFGGLSHYSCLYAAAAEICRQPGLVSQPALPIPSLL